MDHCTTLNKGSTNAVAVDLLSSEAGVYGTAGRPLVRACFGCSLLQKENIALYEETTKRHTIGKRLRLSENVVCIKTAIPGEVNMK